MPYSSSIFGPSSSSTSIASASSSRASTRTSSAAHTRAVGCHSMRTLSSLALSAVQRSPAPGAQPKSVGRAVCPPCTKSSSGAPSSASSGACSAPIRARSQTCTRRSPAADAKTVGACGAQATCRTSPVWPSKVCSRRAGLRRSCSAIVCVESAEGLCRSVRETDVVGAAGDEDVLARGAERDGEDVLVVRLALARWLLRGACVPTGKPVSGVWCERRATNIMSILSSPTDANTFSLVACQSTSCVWVRQCMHLNVRDARRRRRRAL
jgi:hypothetical protein